MEMECDRRGKIRNRLWGSYLQPADNQLQPSMPMITCMQTAVRGTDSKIVDSNHQCVPEALSAILIARKAVSYPTKRAST